MQAEQNEHEQESMAQQAGQVEPKLSGAWRELLGLSSEPAASADARRSYSRADPCGRPGLATGPETGTEIPALTNDPWAELQHGQGIEIVDLRQVHAQALNDLDLEQVLQFMHEQANPESQEK